MHFLFHHCHDYHSLPKRTNLVAGPKSALVTVARLTLSSQSPGSIHMRDMYISIYMNVCITFLEHIYNSMYKRYLFESKTILESGLVKIILTAHYLFDLTQTADD